MLVVAAEQEKQLVPVGQEVLEGVAMLGLRVVTGLQVQPTEAAEVVEGQAKRGPAVQVVLA